MSIATRGKTPKQSTLFDIWENKEGDTFEEGWKNKLIWGDNLLVMDSLLEKFAGKIDLIYIDPPFATGADFSFKTQIGDGDLEVTKEQSIIEEKAYRDTWGKGNNSYIAMMWKRLVLMRDLLSERGTIYVHMDYRLGHYIKLLMDEIFGLSAFLNEIVWHYKRWPAKSANFQRQHDKILVYSNKPGQHQFSVLFMPLSQGTNRRWRGQKSKVTFVDGIRQVTEITDEVSPGAPMDDVWDIPVVNSQATERVDYATQKPEELLERCIEASTEPGDLVADFFCGSGTTLAVAEKRGRRWIGCDLGRFAIHTTRKRLMEIDSGRTFEVLNLGKYERQYWQGVTFGEKSTHVTEQALYEYLAFMLKLYGAQPVPGLTHLHGKKGKAIVHIGAVDAPVTIDEIDTAIAECVQCRQTELHILGWEWEMGLYDLMIPEAKKRGVKLLLLQIPREVMEQQAVDKGDIQFFELAYLEVDIQTPRKLTATVTLKDFVIPNTELIPEEVRAKVKKWSDYIDYWAVDWDFQDDTFMQGWVTYRTRRDRTLALASDSHTYEEPGWYRVFVKVVDIFGNDTSQVFAVEVQ